MKQSDPNFRLNLAAAALLTFAAIAVSQPPATPPPAGTPAEPPPITRAEFQDRIVQGLNAALDVGVPIFNKGDQQGCFQIYQGALLAIKPMLAGSPDLLQGLQAHMDRTSTMSAPSQKAFELRRAIDDIRWAFRKPLWDRLGGESAVNAVVHDLISSAAADPKVNLSRGNAYKLDGQSGLALERKLVEFISSVTGGPLKYSGKDMKAAHAGMRITEEEFNALAGILVTTLKRYRVPQADIDELMGIVGTTKKDIVESGVVAGAPATPPPMKKSLWERLGGENAVKAVVHEFVAAAAANPKVNFTRNGQFKLDADGTAKLEARLVEFVSSVTGGPLPYGGRSMRAAHVGMKITDEEFNAIAVDLATVLKKFSVPQAEIDELLAIVGTTRKDIVGQ